MKNHIYFITGLIAATLLSFACSDDSSGSKEPEKKPVTPVTECNPECTEGYECISGTCKEKGTLTDPDTPSPNACDKCTNTQVCVDNKCEDCNHVVCNNTCCKDGEICHEGTCKAPCESCTATQICTENGCEDCPNTVCKDVCCKEGEACDLFTGECYETLNGKAACNEIFCEENEVCTEKGLCALQCDDDTLACGNDAVCCTDGKQCFEDRYCRIVCQESQTMCGKEKEEVCCDRGYVCEENKCLIACDGTRCGENQELCCDNSKEVCAFNQCVIPTDEGTCKTNDDCDLWSFCDSGSSRCLSQDVDKNACIYRPPVGEFKPKVKWHYEDDVPFAPVVINLTDDNGDGNIDENDIPDVVVVNYTLHLIALSGDDGHVLAKTTEAIYNNWGDFAGADIDGDKKIEILVPTQLKSPADQGLKVMTLEPATEGEYPYQWKEKHFIHATNTYYSTVQSSVFGIDLHPTIADIDSDGHVEIVTTNGVIKGDGDWSKFECSLNIKDTESNWGYYDMFAVADLDQDGQMEIISKDVYDNKCNVIMPATETNWYYAAVADLLEDENSPEYPGELKPEILRVGSGRVSAWKVYRNGDVWTQRKVWDKPQTSPQLGGNPVIADFDGDGKPDIGIAGRTHYTVFNGQTGDIVWASKTQDFTSGRTGSSVFDFEGDGVSEVVYRDETTLRIYAGPGAGKDKDGKIIDKDGDGYMDGKVLWSVTSTSGTGTEYPVIVDVDNDGRTEIVMVSVPYEISGVPTGVTVYSDTYDNWVRTRRIWNEHAYHVTNINEDGTVPMPEKANWLNKRLNNYRANSQPSSGFNAPNFQPNGLEMSLDKCKTTSNIVITAEVKNAGSIGVSAPVAVSFYIKDYEYEGKKYNVYLGTAKTSGPIAADGTTKVQFDWNAKGKITVNDAPTEIVVKGKNLKITYIVDDDNHTDENYIPFNECHEEDNEGLSDVVEFCPEVVS